MARLNAPRPVGIISVTRPDPEQRDKPSDLMHRGWPFAKGSQNNPDDTDAPWPRPASRPAIVRAGPAHK